MGFFFLLLLLDVTAVWSTAELTKNNESFFEDATSSPSAANSTSINPHIYFTLFVTNSSLIVDNETESSYENRTNLDNMLKLVPPNVNPNTSSTFDTLESSDSEFNVPTPSVPLQEDSQSILHISNETVTGRESHHLNNLTDNANATSTTLLYNMSSSSWPLLDSTNSKSTHAFISSLWSSLPSHSPTTSSGLTIETTPTVTYSSTPTVSPMSSEMSTSSIMTTTAKPAFPTGVMVTKTTLQPTVNSLSIDAHTLGTIKPLKKSTIDLLQIWRTRFSPPTTQLTTTSPRPTTQDDISYEIEDALNTSAESTTASSQKVNTKMLHTNSLSTRKRPQASYEDDEKNVEEGVVEEGEDGGFSDSSNVLSSSTQSHTRPYFDFRRQCPEEYAGDVWWNRTYGGVIAVRFCPNGYTGKVYRMCYYGGSWGDVDFSECRVQQLIKLKHLLYYHVHKNLTDGFHSLADELLTSLLRYQLRSVDDYLESLDSLNIIINARVPLDFDVGQDFKYLKTILKISDTLFSRFENKWSFPQQQKEMVTMKIVQVLHGMTQFGNLIADGVKQSSRSVIVFTDYSHIGLEAKVIRENQDFRITPPDSGCAISLPTRFHQKVTSSHDKYVVVTTWYNGIGQTLNEENGLVNSPIFATTVHPSQDIQVLAGPVTASLKILEKIDEGYYPECGYLRRTTNKSSLWSTVGCSIAEVQASTVTCVCHHMANIAVIARHHHAEGHVQWKPISLIVIIGCCISLAALLSTFIAHVHVLRYDSSESSLILLNLIIAMAAAQVVFMGGIQATSSQEVCEGVSIILHYLYLVSSFWLLSHGIHVYLSIKSTKEMSCSSHMRDYCLLSWVVPIALVVITFAVNPHGYEIRKYCWLSIERGMLLSYIVPIFCLITVNTTLMVLVLKHLFENQGDMMKVDIDKARISVRAGVVLLPYFGVNWFLGVLALEDRSTEIFETIFAMSTTIQGLLIFIFFSLLQSEVRKAFKQFTSKVLRRRKSSELKLRRNRRKRSKVDAEPLLVGSEISEIRVETNNNPSNTNLAAQCLPSTEEPFVMVDEENTTVKA